MIKTLIDETRLAERLRALEPLNIDGLREHWRLSFGEPPAIRSGEMMRYLLSERLQEQVYGTDQALRTKLGQLAARAARGDKPSTPKAKFKPGTRLVRIWDGKTYRVEVSEGGFSFNGQRYRSLSAIARLITGTRWNGPLFFGLRDKAKPLAARTA